MTLAGGSGGNTGSNSPQMGGIGGAVSGSGWTTIISMSGQNGSGTRRGGSNGDSGDGGNSMFGFGGRGAGQIDSAYANATAGVGYGSGGGGGMGDAGSHSRAGANGASGIVIIFEYSS